MSMERMRVLWPGLMLITLPLFGNMKPETRQGFDQYIKTAEDRMAKDAATDHFLALGQTKRDQVFTKEMSDGAKNLPHGQIQHWIGGVFLPGANLQRVKSVMQDYENYQRIYSLDVTQSKLLKRNGDDFEVFLKLYKKQILTVVFNSEYRIHYSFPDPKKMVIRSEATRIAEVDDSGHEKAPGEDHGFLWGLNSYWRFVEADGGVYVECEAISLSRDVPALLHAIVGSFLKKFPIESMRNTMEFTKKEVAAR